MRVLITGATGTVGSALVQRFARDPQLEVHAVVRRSTSLPVNVVERVVDLREPRFSRHLNDTTFHCVVHAAQSRDWSRDNPGTESFDLQVVRELDSVCGDRPTKRIYTSGVWIYGHQVGDSLISENSEMRPIAFASDRLHTLEYLRRGSSGRWIEVVLPSLVYGEVGPFVDLVDGVRRGEAVVVDDRSIRWSLIERTDMAEAFHRLIWNSYDERLFVLAEPNSVPVVDVHRMVADTIGVPFSPVSRSGVPSRLTDAQIELITCNQPTDSSLVYARTSWRPTNSFVNSFKQFVR